ncbi:hypothetical protein B0T11DRAFT_85220 [Plectosphaerella cucumerina]|uniref:Uncharacterized protein n=1 Tax=Plectosphaerella cucumerina TaxID=40658 RepID=A0A8K0TLQ5_9PEZI|nr:hypothetical protein B0T11DRAFT_85220 [Plectosphaerella cucumerina]
MPRPTVPAHLSRSLSGDFITPAGTAALLQGCPLGPDRRPMMVAWISLLIMTRTPSVRVRFGGQCRQGGMNGEWPLLGQGQKGGGTAGKWQAARTWSSPCVAAPKSRLFRGTGKTGRVCCDAKSINQGGRREAERGTSDAARTEEKEEMISGTRA